MAITFQVAIDCADPHPLCDFWAAALGYEVEIHGDAIQELLDAGVASEGDVTHYQGRLVWETAAACQDPAGVGPRCLFQKVPEAKTVKNRLHLDLRFGEERRAEEVARLEALGARQLWEGRQGPHSWVTMADPEGNEFCVA